MLLRSGDLKLAMGVAVVAACALSGLVVALDAKPGAAPLRPPLPRTAAAATSPAAVDASPATLPLVNTYVS